MKRFLPLIVLAGVLFSSSLSFASWMQDLKPVRWEVRTGYAYQYTNNKRPDNFETIPVIPSAVVPIRDAVGSGWYHGQWEWNPELLLATFIHPYTRPLWGINPLQFRYVFEPKGPVRPYLFAGAGIVYSDVDRRETGNRLNFNPQFGAGLYCAITGSTSLILEYRHVHLSNAGLDKRNAGINSHTFLAGFSFKR